MTITPMAPTPVLAGDPVAPAVAGDGAGAETFGALIAAQLDRLAEPGVPEQEDATSGAGADDDPTLPEQADPAPMPCTPSQVVLADPSLAGAAAVAAGPVLAPTPSPLVIDAPAEAATEVDKTDGGHGRAAEVRGRSAEAPGHTGVLPNRAVPVPAHPGGTAAGTSDASALPAARVPTPTASDATAVVAAAVPTTEPGAAAPPVTATQPPVVTTVVAPVGATVPVVTPEPVAAPAPANPVLDQVAPVVTRMVSGPEGTHRMMLRLHPADLGEVHLTVTVRGGTVDVTVAAAPEARELLTEGSSQLRGLLDAVGRNAGTLVFRDLPGAGSAVQVLPAGAGGPNPDGRPASSYADPGHDHGRGGGAGPGGHADRTAGPDRHADSRPDHRATPDRTHADGLVRGGLDVRM